MLENLTRILVLRNTFGWRVILVGERGVSDVTQGAATKRNSLKRGGKLSVSLGVPVFYSSGLT